MFKRIALAPIGIIEEPKEKRLVFASNESEEPISFDYDPDNFVYFRCRAITADEANGNGDYFPEDEIRKAYKSFIGVGLYKDHQSDSVDKSIGKVLWAEWVPNGKYVECYCCVDKQLAPDLAHRVKVGIATSVSMGCSVQEAECSICGRTAHNVNELCEHMMPGFGQKGRRNAAGEIIYEINRGIQFNELSLVTVPADPTARIFEIYASLKTDSSLENLNNLKKLYIFHHTPGIYKQKVEDAEVVTGREKGQTIPVYDEPARRDNEQRMKLLLDPDNGFLTPDEIADYRRWIAENRLPSGDSTLNADISDEDFVRNYKRSGRKFWQLAAVDEGPEHKKTIDALRQLDTKGKDETGEQKAKEYFDVIDKAMGTLRQKEKALAASKIQPGTPEYKQARAAIAQEVLPLFKEASARETDLMTAHPFIYKLMRDAEDQYVLYRGYYDARDGEDMKLPPIEDVVSSMEGDGRYSVKVAEFKKLWDRLSGAWASVDNRPFAEVYNSQVRDQNFAMPPTGPNEEVIRKIEELKPERAEHLKQTMQEDVELKKQLEEETKGLSSEPMGVRPPQKEVDPEKSEKARKRSEESRIKKLQEENKRLEEERAQAEKANVPAEVVEQIVEKSPLVGEKPEEEKKKQPAPAKPEEEQKTEGMEASSGQKENEVVIKIDNSLEDLMGLSIVYSKGANLNTSYFEAKQGTTTYRVAAADVLPLPVQDAINRNDPRVATPDQIVSDLTAKYLSLDGFKAWAKKRKKKNRKALLKMMPKEDLAKKMQEPVKSEPEVSVSASVTENGRKNEMQDNTIPKSAAQETEKPALPVTETPKVETKVEETKATEPTNEIQAAFASLAKFVESKLSATAVKVEKVAPKVDGVGKSSTAPEPKAIQEVTKTENPKGHVEAKGSLKAEAMDENWTVNKKELEKEPKMEYGDHPLPTEISVDEKEVKQEAVKVSNSSEHAGKVKKYFGRLGPGAEGEAPVSMDLKSSENSETKLLREALAKAEAEKAALVEKERLNTVADKIYHIVAALKGKNLVKAGRENALVDALTQRFADVAVLDNLAVVVDELAEQAEAPQAQAQGEVENQVVPQIFETTEQGTEKDPAELLSQIWNQ